MPFNCWKVREASTMCCGRARRCSLTPVCIWAGMLRFPLTVAFEKATGLGPS